MTLMLEFMNTVQNKKTETYSPVNTCNTNVNKQVVKEQSAKITTPTQDTFEQKDRKKTIKNVAIGTGIALLAYSTFALVKYRKNYGGLFSKLAEPIKVLKARVNPNGFKPSVKIEEDELAYLNQVATHLKRLTEPQRENYIKKIYETTNFTEQGKNDFMRHFGRYIES